MIWVTFAWRTLRVSVLWLSCRTAAARAGSTGAVRGWGRYARCCYRMLKPVEIPQCSSWVGGVRCRCCTELLKPVEILQVQFLDVVSDCSRCLSFRTAEARGDFHMVQFLDEVVFMPFACRQFWGPDVQKTVVFSQLQSRQGG